MPYGLAFVVFAGMYYVMRLALFYEGLAGNAEFESDQSALVEGVVIYSFLLIGVAGLLFLPGVYLLKRWAFLGTLIVSGHTIVFDVWAAIAVQASAAAGIIPAAVIAGYLLHARNEFRSPRKRGVDKASLELARVRPTDLRFNQGGIALGCPQALSSIDRLRMMISEWRS